MHAYVYKSQRKSDTYVYLRERDGFELIPEPLRTPLGALAFVLEVELTLERKLAREDVVVVHANLAASVPRQFDNQRGTVSEQIIGWAKCLHRWAVISLNERDAVAEIVWKQSR